MNKKKVTLLLLGILAVFIAGCAGLMERHDGTQEQAKIYIQDIYKGAHRDVPKFLIRNDKMATLYLTGKRRVVFKRGDDTMLLDEDVKDKGYARSPLLYAENNHVYAMWWAKTPPRGDKYLYFRASHDGGKTFEPTKIINSGNGVINYYLASDGKGVLAFVYDDERENPYQVYFNISCDYGKTWLDKDIRLDSIQRSDQKRGVFAIEPKVFINGQTLVLTWKERREEEEKAFYYIKSRTSNDGGKSWANEVVIRKANTIFFSDNLIVHNNILYITGQENGTGISGFRSVNNGMTWESIGAIPGTEATVNSGLKVISRGNTLYAVYTSETQHEKNQIWFSAYSPSENKWNKPVRLDRKRNNLTKAINPDFTALKDGTFVAVWEDYRDIRPNIYMNTSTDNGKTWQDNDSPLGIKGRYSYTLPNLLTKDDTFFVFIHKYRNDAWDKTDYLYREFKIDKGYSFKDIEVGRQLSDSEKEKKLKERIASFWTLRTKGQFTDTYDYHDPFFREKESKDNFARVQGNITYNRFKVAEIDIKENIANVKIDYNFEVKGVKIMGMEVSQKPTDDILLEEWVWIYDNWYRVWQNTFGQKYIEY